MKSSSLAKLLEYQKKLAVLQKEVAAFNRNLNALPAKFGFTSMESFIAALRAASGSGKARVSVRKKRVHITADMRLKIKSMVQEGRPGREIAETLGISLQSVQNSKKRLGLVKSRK